jgi:AbiV family abortive infection protein
VKKMVNKQFLLEGAVYALQHCGTLLRDAVALCDQGSYPSAVVLALFGREELGKCRILMNAFEKVEAGETVELKALKKQITNHMPKQTAALLGFAQSFDNDSPLGKALRTIQSDTPDSPEFQEALRLLDESRQARSEEIPNERHEFRMSMLYVEMNDDGSGWKRPQEQSNRDAEKAVIEAVGDYSVTFQSLIGVLGYIGQFKTALQAWSGRPTILEPVWPKKVFGT